VGAQVVSESEKPNSDQGSGLPKEPHSRMQLIWDVIVFQFKLMLDGLRDVVLIPVSITAAILGLIIGGSKPGQYFEQVLKLGRRTEFWLNLFGHRRHSGTSDDIFKPIQDKVFDRAERNPWLNKAGSSLNRSLDKVGERIQPPQKNVQSPPEDPPTPDQR
jgi:hypothetical protein